MTSRAFVRPMKKWWMRDPFFLVYMAREATALFVAGYALVLLVGLVRLAQGEAAWNAWLAALKTPASIALHALMLAALIYHTWSWFRIMPKTMPLLFAGTRRVPGALITGAGLAAAAVACVSLAVLLRGLP
jgi:fumarate reductase subunit C